MGLRSRTSLLLVSCGLSCTLVVDRSRWEDGGGAGGALLTGGQGGGLGQGGQPGQGGEAGQGGQPPNGSCVPALFHVSFDEPTTDSWLGSTLIQSGASGELTNVETRRGAGAWRLPLGETDPRSFLRSFAVDKEGVEHWIGFSQRHLGPAITYGTRTFTLECLYDGPPWEKTLYGTFLDDDTPGLPYYAGGAILQLGSPSLDALGTIAGGADYADWAVRFLLSREDDGYVDVYRDRTLVFSYQGVTVHPDCPSEGFQLQMGLGRWQGFGDGGADMAPPQTLEQDEITLLRGPLDPVDALYTLWPDSGCFD